jgi:hypothetical protein
VSSAVAGLLGCRVAERLRVTAEQLSNRATLQLFIAVVLFIAVPTALHACPVCYGSSDSAMVKGSNNGILFMLGIIGFVQIGFLALFYTFWRRARALRRRRESFRVINGGV